MRKLGDGLKYSRSGTTGKKKGQIVVGNIRGDFLVTSRETKMPSRARCLAGKIPLAKSSEGKNKFVWGDRRVTRRSRRGRPEGGISILRAKAIQKTWSGPRARKLLPKVKSPCTFKRNWKPTIKGKSEHERGGWVGATGTVEEKPKREAVNLMAKKVEIRVG